MIDPPPSAGGTGCPAELINICARRHWSLFWLLITVSVAWAGARILTLGADGTPPFFSANDRSRWATVRTLGDEGTYRLEALGSDANAPSWQTIDRVQRQDPDGQWRDYSSKPPLLTTLVAGVYRGIRALTGWTLAAEPVPVARAVLLLVNLVPFALFLYAFAQLVNTIPVRDWTRYFALMAAGTGTFLSTWVVTLNNHLPAACAVMLALWWLVRIGRGQAGWLEFAGVGLMGGMAAALDLPALAFCALSGAVCGWYSWKQTLAGWLPAVLLVAAAFFGTNFLAHGDWRLPYAHRSDGPVAAQWSGDHDSELDRGRWPSGWSVAGLELPRVEPGRWPGTPKSVRRWVVTSELSGDRFALIRDADGAEYELREWSNWYDYPGSYWRDDHRGKSEIDRGEPSPWVYLFHLLFGHHGIFSLTPLWLLAAPGLIALCFADRLGIRWLGWAGWVLTLLVLSFYLSRPEMDRNYGGVTSGLRWMFWLIPIWLVGILPVVDWLGQTSKGRWVCFGLLGLSILSAGYAFENPWVHPWLYECWDWTGLPK